MPMNGRLERDIRFRTRKIQLHHLVQQVRIVGHDAILAHGDQVGHAVGIVYRTVLQGHVVAVGIY